MAFSYTGSPSTSANDRVRFLIQDVTDPGLLSDEEIAWMMTEEGGDAYRTSAALCLVLARRFATQPGSRSIGDVSISYSDLTDRYTKLAASLTARSARTSVPTPYLGGLLQSDKDANDSSLNDHVPRVFADSKTWVNP